MSTKLFSSAPSFLGYKIIHTNLQCRNKSYIMHAFQNMSIQTLVHLTVKIHYRSADATILLVDFHLQFSTKAS